MKESAFHLAALAGRDVAALVAHAPSTCACVEFVSA
jgi:hypothetical protein